MILLITLVFRFQGAGFLFGTGTDDGFIAHLTRRYLLTIALSVVAILLSLWHGNFGLLLCIGLTLMYLLPSCAPVFNRPP